MATSYLDCPLVRFAELVAAREPAPGGGPVAAVTVSLAAALAAMAARYSAEIAPGQALVEAAEQLSSRAAGLAGDDADAYRTVIDAYATPKSAHPARRREQIRNAMQRAAGVAVEIAQLGAETATLAARLAVEGNRSVRGDAATAVLLAEAATRSAAHLVALDVDAGGCDHELVRRAQSSVDAARSASLRLSLEESSPAADR